MHCIWIPGFWKLGQQNLTFKVLTVRHARCNRIPIPAAGRQIGFRAVGSRGCWNLKVGSSLTENPFTLSVIYPLRWNTDPPSVEDITFHIPFHSVWSLPDFTHFTLLLWLSGEI